MELLASEMLLAEKSHRELGVRNAIPSSELALRFFLAQTHTHRNRTETAPPNLFHLIVVREPSGLFSLLRK